MGSLSLPLASDSQGEILLYEDQTLDADLRTVVRGGLAEQLAPLAHTTKMPCPAWDISAFRCRIGSVLAQQEGTTCSRCYSRKGRFWNLNRRIPDFTAPRSVMFKLRGLLPG